MNKNLHQSTQKLIDQIIYPFYQLERDMGLPIREVPENDAEHSWSLALGACALAPIIDPKLNTGKIAEFAIVHDLVEVYAGDVSIYNPQELDHELKAEKEHQALLKLQKNFQDLAWMPKTLEEYERKDTPEANYVWAMDKYLAMRMRLSYAQPFFQEKKITKKLFDQSIKRMHHKVHAHPVVGELFDELIANFDTHPEWFYTEKVVK